MRTNAAMHLLCLGMMKTLLKIFNLVTDVLCIEKNVCSSVEEHLLLLIKSKIDYLPPQALKDGLPVGYIASGHMAISRVIAYICKQCDHLTNKMSSDNNDAKKW